MKKIFIIAVLCAAQLLSGAVKITINADRKNFLYKAGETVTFTVKAADDGKALAGTKVELTLTEDGLTLLKKETAVLDSEGKAVISGSLNKPGFLRCGAMLVHKNKRSSSLIGAGFDVDKITPAVAKPADFDKFWAEALKKAASANADFIMEKLDKLCTAKSDAYKVSVASPGGRTYGFLRIPKSKKAVPLQVSVPGAGPSVTAPPADGKHNIAALYANVHSYDPLDPAKSSAQAYREISAKGHYMHRSYENLENNQLYNSIIGINTLIDCVARLPEIDSGKLVYSGSSQGGGFGIILAGLVPNRFKAVVSNITALCDLNGYLAGRNSGWPAISAATKMSDLSKKNIVYFDAANFATRIKDTKVTVVMGYADPVCAPSSVYAMYNSLGTADKSLIPVAFMGHQVWNSYTFRVDKMLASVCK